METQSESGKLNIFDVQRWLKNALIFTAPVAVIYLGSVATKLNDGFAWSDFKVDTIVLGAIALYVVNTFTDLFRKLVTGTK